MTNTTLLATGDRSNIPTVVALEITLDTRHSVGLYDRVGVVSTTTSISKTL